MMETCHPRVTKNVTSLAITGAVLLAVGKPTSHVTSSTDPIAGHCRRRKIRCQLPLPEDAQGRCTNCIRLKKECNFYPVDQAPPVEAKSSQQGHRDTGMSGAPSVSSQSSPHISGASQPGSIADEAVHMHLQSPKADSIRQQREGASFPVRSHPEGGYSVLYAHRSDLLTQDVGITHAAPYQFAAPSGTSWNEQQHPISHYPQQPREPLPNQHYWSPNNTPTTTHYNHETNIPYSASTPSSFHSPNLAYSQGGNPQFIPARAMSYGQIELPQQFNYQAPQYGSQDSHPTYTLPSQPQFSHNTFPQQGPASMSQQSVPSESTPRSWSVSSPGQVTMTAGQSYHQNLPPTFYNQQQQSIGGYDPRGQAQYGHQNYYNPGAHPG